MIDSPWLDWAKRLQALAQTGLTYAHDPYDVERYNKHGHPPLAFHTYKLFFQCELRGGTATPSSETDAVAFFRADALPELSLSRVMPAQIARLFDHYRHPEWPTDFD